MEKVLFLQMMKQRKLNIPALLLLFTFLLGTIGVNVSKIYCNRCQETYLHVMVVPADVPCPCTHGCVCCQTCHDMHNNCDNARQDHTFYKVSGEWAASYYEVQFDLFVQSIAITPILFDNDNLFVKSFDSYLAYIDTSPPLELLCTYRC